MVTAMDAGASAPARQTTPPAPTPPPASRPSQTAAPSSAGDTFTPSADLQEEQAAASATPTAGPTATPTPGSAAPAAPQITPVAAPTPTPSTPQAPAPSSQDINGLSGQDRIQHIVDHYNDNRVVGNAQVTQSYHDISNAFNQVQGGGGANWTTYASWASKTAGDVIRGDKVPGIDQGPFRAQTEGATADGNKKVYQEIAPKFQSYIDEFGKDSGSQPDWNKFNQWADKNFTPGNINADGSGGQDWLRSAFSNYYAAKYENDPQKKEQETALANIQVAYHEQTRLNGNISAAVPLGGFGTGFGPLPGVSNLAPPLEGPDGSHLGLDHDVPGQVQDNLKVGNGPTAVPGYGDTVNSFTHGFRNSDTLKGTATSDWRDINQRMNYITGLIQSQNNNPALFNDVFWTGTDGHPDEVSQINSGDVPGGWSTG